MFESGQIVLQKLESEHVWMHICDNQCEIMQKLYNVDDARRQIYQTKLYPDYVVCSMCPNFSPIVVFSHPLNLCP